MTVSAGRSSGPGPTAQTTLVPPASTPPKTGAVTPSGARPQAPPALLAEPVAQRQHLGAGLLEASADGGHDLVRAVGVAVDADGVDLHVYDLAGDGPDLALHRH